MSSEEANKPNPDPQPQSEPEKDIELNVFKDAINPGVCFFTILFKTIAICTFLLLGWVCDPSIVFITVVLSSSIDFWFVKNVSGRILVGLRWWNEIREDGEDVWIYESANEIKKDSLDTRVFWWSIYITPLFWLFFLAWDTIKFQFIDTISCSISLLFASANLVGYYKCSNRQKKAAQEFIKNKSEEAVSGLIQNFVKN